MKVLYDYQTFTYQRFGGVSKCFCELIKHMPAQIDCEIAIKQSDNVHLWDSGLVPNLKHEIINERNLITKKMYKGKGRLYYSLNRLIPFFPSVHNINRDFSLRLVKEQRFDVFHPTFFDTYYLPYLGSKPFVFTVHDMMPELFPEYFDINHEQIINKKILCEKAAAIVAVSNQTKKDLVNILGVPSSKITVIYHGGPERESIKEKRIIGEPYFLYVGLRNAYKNFKATLEEFALFSKENPDVKLVCTGNSFVEEELNLIAELNLNDKVETRKVNDNELKNLYAYAVAFIYPSKYEGFGMPILEAYSYGCPVLLNNASCFPEIAGDAAIYFELNENKRTLAEKMKFIFEADTNDRTEIIEHQFLRLSQYSWSTSSRLLADLYFDISH